MQKFTNLLRVLLLPLLFLLTSESSAQKYCYPTFSSGCTPGLDSVKFISAINKFEHAVSSAKCSNGIDTSTLTETIKLYRGKNYAFRSLSSGNANFALFIDFNGDGDFEDPGEFLAVDNLGNNRVFESTVFIPLTTKTGVTRLRIIASNATTDGGSSCNSSLTTGVAQDFTLEIAAFDDDLSVFVLNSPVNYGCAGSSVPVKVVVRNLGKNTQNSIPVEVVFGSSTITTTFSATLAHDEQDTFTMSSTVSTTAGSSYNVAAYTLLKDDEDLSNDSFKYTIRAMAVPNAPSVSNADRCGTGSFSLTGTSTTTGSKTYWYNKATTDSAMYVGNTYNTPQFNRDTSLFYESRQFASGSLGSSLLGNRANWGAMFDIQSKTDIIIDSFDIHLNTTNTNDAEIYYRKGGYRGYETSSKDWVYVGKVSITGQGANNPTRLPLGGIKLEAGYTYGIYIFWSGGQHIYYYHVPLTHQNSDVKLVTGSTTMSLFSQVTAGRNWEGRVYYRYDACRSQRKEVKLQVKPAPVGAAIKTSTPFTGYLNAGDMQAPDFVCPGDTVSYEFEPPTPSGNAGLGTVWKINQYSLKTLKGSNVGSADATITNPTTSGNGKITFHPEKKWTDSTFVFTVQIEMIDGGCSQTLTRYVSIGARPTANFGFTSVCIGKTTNFYDSSSVPTGIVGYKYDFGNNNFAYTRFPTYTFKTAGKHPVTLTLTTAKGCTDMITKDVVVYDFPKPDFSANTVCNGKATEFKNNTPDAASMSGFLWRFGNGSTSTQANPFHNYSASGNYNVTLIATSKGGCIDSVTKTIEVLPMPKADFSSSVSCPGTAITLTNTSATTGTSTLSYLWRFEDGSTSTQTNISRTLTDEIPQLVTLVVTSSNGCKDSISRIISYASLPVAAFTANTVCQGKITAFTNQSTGAAKYFWNFGNGSAISIAENPSQFYAKAGDYNVTLWVENASGCRDSITKTITVSAIPKAAFTVATNCLGQSSKFVNTSSFTGTGALKYSWDFGNGNTSTDKDPSFTFSSIGSHDVKLRVESAAGCADSTVIRANVVAGPAIGFTTAVDPLNYRNLTFTPSDLNLAQYKWYFGDGDSSSEKTPTHKFPAFATYYVTLLATDANGCRSTHSDSVTVKVLSIAGTDKLSSTLNVYPNPFSGSANISLNLAENSYIQLSIFDLQGREIARVADGRRAAGAYNFTFNANDYNAGAGIYIMKAIVNDKIYTTQIVNVK